jgi:rhamnosyltransferase
MRRVVFYLFFDPQGKVDDYISYKLERLRRHAEYIFVVSNGQLTDDGRVKLGTVADRVWERENVGFDVWGYKEAMETFGWDRLAEYDEVLLLNYTFFGPIGSFDDLFATMDADREIDFWGLTEHAALRRHPFQVDEPMHAHIQSHWIAVRRSMAASEHFAAYWDEMPMITSYADSVLLHESRFTQHFLDLGFRSRVAFPTARYEVDHPVLDSAAEMVRDGLPIVKRRVFFHDPLYFENRSIAVRRVVDELERRGYPVDLLLSNLARTSKPRDLVTNLALLEVLPHVDLGYDASAPLRIAAVAHVFYPDMTGELLDRFGHLPGSVDLIFTTTDERRRTAIRAELDRRGLDADVRIVRSNRGRDISAFLIACRDVIESDDYDLVVKLHSKKSPQDGYQRAETFKRHLFDNLLPSPGYAANVVALFQRYSSLGMVLPPVVHLGYPTLGHSWFSNRGPAVKEAKRLGISVPFDDTTPIAANGSMFIARPAALRPLLRGDYSFDDFPDEGGYADGTLAHVLERLLAYSALSEGYHIREVMCPELAAEGYTMLEYRVQATSALMPASPRRQLIYLRRARRHQIKRKQERARRKARRQRLAAVKAKLAESERTAKAIGPAYRLVRRAYRRTPER